MRSIQGIGAAVVQAAAMGWAGHAAAEPAEIAMWSNGPDEPAKTEWVPARVTDFEAANQPCTVKVSFIPTTDIYTHAQSAVCAGQAPALCSRQPDQPEFRAGGFLEPRNGSIP